MVGMAPHVPRSRDPTLASSPQLSNETGATGGTNAMATRSGEKEKIKPLVVLAAAIAAIGGLIFGYDIGGSGGTFTMHGFRRQMGWPILAKGEAEPSYVSDEMGWITSVFALGAVAGSLVSGYCTDKFGRRPTIILYAFIFTIAAIIMGITPEINTLYVGRFIGGIGVGGLSMAATMYQSEIAPERIRGKLISLQQLCITFGILLAACANVGLEKWDEGWRISYCGNGILSALLVVLMFFCPESPRWLHKVGRNAEARATLHKVLQSHEVDYEMDKIAEDERIAQIAAASSWKDLFKHANNMRYRTSVGVAVLFLQQCTGINAVFYFAPVIFNDFLGTSLSLLCNLLLTAINFVSTFITIALVDKYGRRTLLTYSAALMATFCCVIAILSSSLTNYQTDSAVAALIVIFCALYVISFAFGWGPVGWIVPAEIFPLELRGKGMTLSTTGNWLCNFAIGRLTPTILRPSVFNLWGTFLFFGAFCVGMVFLTLLYVPETALVALEDMDAVVAKFRKLSPAHRMTKVNLVVDPTKTATSSPSQMEMSKGVGGNGHANRQAAPVV